MALPTTSTHNEYEDNGDQIYSSVQIRKDFQENHSEVVKDTKCQELNSADNIV